MRGHREAAVAVGRRILDSTEATAGLDVPGAVRAVVFGAIGVGLIAAMGVALATLLRRAAPANILLALVVIGGQLLSAAVPEGARRYLPSATLEALVTTNPGGETLAPNFALTVLTVETLALLAAAAHTIVRAASRSAPTCT